MLDLNITANHKINLGQDFFFSFFNKERVEIIWRNKLSPSHQRCNIERKATFLDGKAMLNNSEEGKVKEEDELDLELHNQCLSSSQA